jgi:hypothetical protein
VFLVTISLLAVGGERVAAGAEVRSVQTRVDAEPGVYEMDAVIVLDTTVHALRHVVSRMCDYRREMPFMAYCRVFKKSGHTSWSYVVISPPVFQARDYVIASTVLEDLREDGSGPYRTAWQRVTDQGPPPRDGVVRLKANEGSWSMVPVDGGKRTEVRYRVKTSPGGIIPAWAAAYVQKTTLPQYARTIERIAQRESVKAPLRPTPGDPWQDLPVEPLDPWLFPASRPK